MTFLIAYKQNQLSQDNSVLLKNSYQNAIAAEWLFYLENELSIYFKYEMSCVSDDVSNGENIKAGWNALQAVPNIISALVDYVYCLDSLTFDNECFSMWFESYMKEIVMD